MMDDARHVDGVIADLPEGALHEFTLVVTLFVDRSGKQGLKVDSYGNTDIVSAMGLLELAKLAIGDTYG